MPSARGTGPSSSRVLTASSGCSVDSRSTASASNCAPGAGGRRRRRRSRPPSSSARARERADRRRVFARSTAQRSAAAAGREPSTATRYLLVICLAFPSGQCGHVLASATKAIGPAGTGDTLASDHVGRPGVRESAHRSPFPMVRAPNSNARSANSSNGPSRCSATQGRLRSLLQANRIVVEELELEQVLRRIAEAAVDAGGRPVRRARRDRPRRASRAVHPRRHARRAGRTRSATCPEGRGLLGAVIDERQLDPARASERRSALGRLPRASSGDGWVPRRPDPGARRGLRQPLPHESRRRRLQPGGRGAGHRARRDRRHRHRERAALRRVAHAGSAGAPRSPRSPRRCCLAGPTTCSASSPTASPR